MGATGAPLERLAFAQHHRDCHRESDFFGTGPEDHCRVNQLQKQISVHEHNC